MPLTRNLTLPTGITLSPAYGDVTDWNLQGHANIGVITVTWWASKAAHDAGLPPVQVDPPVTLSPQEQQSGAVQLITVLYNMILARPEYAGTAVV